MKKYKLIDTDGKIYLSETPSIFGRNGKLKIYSRLDCHYMALSLDKSILK